MIERRVINQKVERKAADTAPDSRAIGGIAAMVNTPTELWRGQWNGKTERFVEIIAPGAFNDVLGNDVRALVNHNDEKILGRTSAGTLKVYLNEAGHLGYDVPDVPNTTYGNDLIVSVERGDITQSSFAFRIGEDLKSTEETATEITYTRTITKISELLDVSPVTYPAYSETVTELRGRIESEVTEMRKKTEPSGPTLEQINDFNQQRLKILLKKKQLVNN